MSDDDEDQIESETYCNYNGILDGPDSNGFGPLVPTENERFLMERVRQELKQEFKQVTIYYVFVDLGRVQLNSVLLVSNMCS